MSGSKEIATPNRKEKPKGPVNRRSVEGRVLMIYTGGTIGMLPLEEGNPLSPLVPADWQRLKGFVPVLRDLPLHVELEEMKLIDSSDMDPDYWIDIAKVIGKRYRDFDGFVVLHGTDTMTYTATALSFLLENLGKPVILTGSQLPIGKPRSDAVQNLVTSIMLAAPRFFNLPLVPEVCIFFHDLLIRGNRARKVSSSEYAGFYSPNYPVLGKAGEHIRIDKRLIRSPGDRGFFINERLERNVLMFDIFPGIQPQILHQLFDIPHLRGVVLRTFGAGNAPTSEDFLREIEYGIHEKNLAIVNVTQCNEVMVEMGLYDASAQLQRLGVFSGVDMTPEAALVKMQFLLGLGYDIETAKEQMQKDLRGEQSVNVFNFFYEQATANPVFKAPAKQLPAGLTSDKIVAANIRVDAASLLPREAQGEIKLSFFINYPAAENTVDLSDEACLAVPQCLGIVSKATRGQSVNVILDCRDRLGMLWVPGRPAQVSIVARGGKTVRWDGASISVYTNVG